MKKYRIAFCGVFDLANYGDHLFPIIFKSEMEKRGLNIELILFSPIECEQAFDNSVHVYSLRNLEKMQMENSFDAFIIAGGEIIHLFRFFQKTKIGAADYEEYPISETWLIPAFVANKYRVKLIWNTPGIPFPFDNHVKNFIKAICDSTDYLSIRNIFSKECLIECGINEDKIKIIPDTALALSKTIKFNYLVNIREHILSKEKYIVFHCNKFINENQISTVIKCLEKLAKKGFKIVLLPLAYTHGDDVVLQKINELSNYQFFVFDKSLSIDEMISVLAGCFLYIGVSFHGAITALQYGKKVIAFDYMKNDKTRNLFEYFDIAQNYIIKESDLEEVINYVMNNDKTVEMENAVLELDEHFDCIFETISMPKDIYYDNHSFAFRISQGIVDCNMKYKEIEKELIVYKEAINNNDFNKINEEKLEAKNKYIKVLEESNLWYKSEIESYSKILEESRKTDDYIKYLGESHKKKDDYIKSIEESSKNKDNYIESLLESHKNKDLYIESQEENLKNKDGYIESLEANHKKQDEYIESLEENHKLKDDYIKKIEGNQLQIEQYVSSLEESLKWEKDMLIKKEQDYNDKFNDLEILITNLRKTVFEMEQSISWKITKILRKGK